MGIIQTTKELRPRQENDFYPTPIELCRAALHLFAGQNFKTILDPGCGTGVWGQAARSLWPASHITGIDIVDRLERPSAYNRFCLADFLSLIPDAYPDGSCYSLIIGNPPYQLAQEFIEKGMRLLAPHGTMMFLLRLNFLEGQKRGKGLWKTLPPSDVYVCSRRPSYTGNGKTDATAYSLICWGKQRFSTNTQTYLHWLDWDYDK